MLKIYNIEMILIRGSFLLAIYGISCCYSLRLDQFASDRQNISKNTNHPSLPEDDKSLATLFFSQKVNHFDENDAREWKQVRIKDRLTKLLLNMLTTSAIAKNEGIFKASIEMIEQLPIFRKDYYQNDTYYQEGGPVYLWIEGNEFPLSFRLKRGYWVEHAKKHHAMLFSISHRFHKFSFTLENTSTDNLIYLSVSQALSDYVAFIEGMNKFHNFPKNTKWIVFGSSYGGNLAAWMRTKYHDLVHGAVASSAPVLAQMNFPEYLENVASSIESFNKKCKKDIALAHEKLDKLVKSKNGRKEIGKTFKLCDPLDGSSLNTSVFMDDMISYISHEIETDLENEKVKKICDTMLKNADTKTPVQRYALLMDTFLGKYRPNKKCINTNFHALIESLQEDDVISSCVSGRSWLYQLCTEFGWFQTTEKKSSTFGTNIKSDFYIQRCSRTFGASFNKKFISEAVDNTNESYNGLKLNTARTLFVHGSADPWRNLGITSNKNNKNVEVIIVNGGSHASDSSYEYMNSKNKNRKVAIDKIMTTLDSWLKK